MSVTTISIRWQARMYAIQETRGQRVAAPSTDADHSQHEPVIGRSCPNRSGIGQNAGAASQAERRFSSTAKEPPPIDFEHENGTSK
jgi:hypothetical protein